MNNENVLKMTNVTREKFDLIKRNYWNCASWAIWSRENNEEPASNTGDMNILDPEKNDKLLSQLKPDVIFVGLSISRKSIEIPLSNFHVGVPQQKAFRIRFAFRDTPYWGGYMTDIIKDFPEVSSAKVMKYLRSHSSFEQEQIETFRRELKDLGTENPTIIAFGKDVFKILKRNFKEEFKILKVTHYSYWKISKEKYREQVKTIC